MTVKVNLAYEVNTFYGHVYLPVHMITSRVDYDVDTQTGALL